MKLIKTEPNKMDVFESKVTIEMDYLELSSLITAYSYAACYANLFEEKTGYKQMEMLLVKWQAKVYTEAKN